MRLTVADLMSVVPVTVTPETSLSEALKRLVAAEATELYVVGPRKKLLGILSDFEVLKARLSGCDEGATVAQWMVAHVETLAATADLAEATQMFRSGRCSRIAIVSGGRLCGVLTRSEILRFCVALRVDIPCPGNAIPAPAFQRHADRKTKKKSQPTTRSSPRATTKSKTGTKKSTPAQSAHGRKTLVG